MEDISTVARAYREARAAGKPDLALAAYRRYPGTQTTRRLAASRRHRDGAGVPLQVERSTRGGPTMTDPKSQGNGADDKGKIEHTDSSPPPWTGSGTGPGPAWRRLGEFWDWLATATGWRKPGDKE
jgi:hypothetical protein